MTHRFKHPESSSNEYSVRIDCLPARGSDHPAFVEMLFSWSAPYETDPRFRQVHVPKGFYLEPDGDESFRLRNQLGYPRARVFAPKSPDQVPSIMPLKRYSAEAERVPGGWRMRVSEWGTVVVRGDVYETETGAVNAAREWLNEHKSGWESYSSAINFTGKPPR